MIISRTPYRISFFGGGTDYPQWFKEHGGAVLGLAIDKYCYISVRHLPPFFEHKHRIVYSVVEDVKSVDEIDHPAVRAVFTDMRIEIGLEMHHDGDLPARSGLGSSSSFTVGLINSLHALNGRMVSKRSLAESAIRIEQDVIGENVGSQDQIWAAYGGLNRIDFTADGSFSVRPIIMNKERISELTDSTMLFFTGISRIASEIAGKKIANMKAKEKNLHTMRAMVDEAEAILTNPKRPLREIGELLGETWRLKRELASGVTTKEIDDIFEAAQSAGALGGKLIGAGGGGFALLYVEPERQSAVRERLSNLVEVRVAIDNAGSTIVVYNPNGLHEL